MEEVVMHMSDIFVVASFDATNFPQYIYGRGLWGSPLIATIRNEHIF